MFSCVKKENKTPKTNIIRTVKKLNKCGDFLSRSWKLRNCVYFICISLVY